MTAQEHRRRDPPHLRPDDLSVGDWIGILWASWSSHGWSYEECRWFAMEIVEWQAGKLSDAAKAGTESVPPA